jgi:hypothetical protein
LYDFVKIQIRQRAQARDPSWHLHMPAYVFDVFVRSGVEDHMIANDHPTAEVAMKLPRVAGRLP